MKRQKVEQLVMPFNLQFFAEEGEGNDTAGGNSGGIGEGDGAGTAGTDDTAGGEGKKTFDDILKDTDYQSEFDRRVQKAINTALSKQKDKYEALMDDKLSEAEKLSKMTKDEKEQYLSQKKEQDLIRREAEVTRKELMAEAKNTLAEKKLPVALAEVLNYSDADTCKASIEAVEKAFQTALEAAVEEKLKGGAPLKTAPNEGSTQLEQIRKAMSE
ncbi:MAG: DUF4355 domain-containing protein [Lachnospiraceae bacterium]|nr:DUF4355 domain-containing protein [Lachnospiraceae bacterium]